MNRQLKSSKSTNSSGTPFSSCQLSDHLPTASRAVTVSRTTATAVNAYVGREAYAGAAADGCTCIGCTIEDAGAAGYGLCGP